ncbi:MAG: hypothetical protein Kow0063_09510 [Anaerolineae bacterium]
MLHKYERGFDSFEWIRGQESDHWKTARKDVKLPENRDKIGGWEENTTIG